ncbi:MAG: helix-turn-helix domain-containing protein [bacterium]
MNYPILKNLGLDQNEEKSYVFLLENGASSPTDIEKKTGIHRPIVYKSLESLKNKKLVNVSPKGKRTLYFAESPEKLESMFRELEKTFFSDVEDLHTLYELGQKNKPRVTYSEGKQAIQDSYMDIPNTLEKDAEYYRYMSMENSNREKFLPKGYRVLRDKKGLESMIITNKSSKKDAIKLGRRVKTLPDSYDLFDYNIGQVIYGDKVAIVDYDSQTVITINHPKFAEFQKKIFKLLFEKI